jgi:hypothetical protein
MTALLLSTFRGHVRHARTLSWTQGMTCFLYLVERTVAFRRSRQNCHLFFSSGRASRSVPVACAGLQPCRGAWTAFGHRW